jgi:hypothetical protein
MMVAGLEHVNVARRRVIERWCQKKAGLKKSPA